MTNDRETAPPIEGSPNAPGMSGVVTRNVAALAEMRRAEDARRSKGDRVADAITRFAGSMWCVYAHATWFGGWLFLNAAHVPGIKPWDPYPFVMLAMIASVEAIFLSTFILISQNRMQKVSDRRAELDLQVSLLAEHELTRAIQLLDAIGRHLGAAVPQDADLRDAQQDVHLEKLADQIRHTEQP